jgi:hypothetical protein
MSTLPIAVETWKKRRCPTCGTTAERSEHMSPADLTIWCDVCATHRYHGVTYANCPVCIAELWRSRLRAVFVLAFQLLHSTGESDEK